MRIDEPAVLFLISNTYKGGRAGLSVYEATRRAWRMNPKLHPDMQYALGVDQGKVMAVFRIDRWSGPDQSGRWEFDGVRDHAMTSKYLGADVSECFTRNPVAYANC